MIIKVLSREATELLKKYGRPEQITKTCPCCNDIVKWIEYQNRPYGEHNGITLLEYKLKNGAWFKEIVVEENDSNIVVDIKYEKD